MWALAWSNGIPPPHSHSPPPTHTHTHHHRRLSTPPLVFVFLLLFQVGDVLFLTMHRAERIHAADGEGMLSRQKALMGHPEMSDAQFCNRFFADCRLLFNSFGPEAGIPALKPLRVAAAGDINCGQRDRAVTRRASSHLYAAVLQAWSCLREIGGEAAACYRNDSSDSGTQPSHLWSTCTICSLLGSLYIVFFSFFFLWSVLVQSLRLIKVSQRRLVVRSVSSRRGSFQPVTR